LEKDAEISSNSQHLDPASKVKKSSSKKDEAKEEGEISTTDEES